MSSRLRYPLITAGVIVALLSGCGKKEEPAPAAPVVETPPQTSLFDEFYDSEPEIEESYKAEIKEEPVAPAPVKKETPSYLEPDFNPHGIFVVQISTIASEAIAEDVARKLERKGYPVYVAEVINPTPQLIGKYYRVRIGGFSTVSAAEYFGENFLIPEGYNYWVDNRSNDNVGIGDFGLGQTSDNRSGWISQEAPANPAVVEQPKPQQQASQNNFIVEESDDDDWGTSEW